MDSAVISLTRGAASVAMLAALLSEGYKKIVCVNFYLNNSGGFVAKRDTQKIFLYYRDQYPEENGVELIFKPVDFSSVIEGVQRPLFKETPNGKILDDFYTEYYPCGYDCEDLLLHWLSYIAKTYQINQMCLPVDNGRRYPSLYESGSRFCTQIYFPLSVENRMLFTHKIKEEAPQIWNLMSTE